MFRIRTTPVFDAWFDTLRDRQIQARIQMRIRRLAMGNAGDCRNLKGGVSELRIDTGPGYRVYYCHAGRRHTCCCVVETSARNRPILNGRRLWLARFGIETETESSIYYG